MEKIHEYNNVLEQNVNNIDHSYFFCNRWIDVYIDGTERYSDTGDIVPSK